MKQVKIGAGQGFYGDIIEPALDLAENTDVQYLAFDTLAELTLAILQKDRQKDPSLGYTKDITRTARTLLPYVHEKGIKLITNAGGLNPEGARREVMRVAKELGITGIKVGVATGDDLFHRLDELERAGVDLSDTDTGRPLEEVRDRLLFASAYLGARPIVEALEQGADVVITGRTTDTAQFLAPAVFELGWRWDDWDKLAQGLVLGHLMECSGQVTGGNFSGDWWNIEDLDRIGYPLAEVSEDGSFVITKAPGTGGRVSVDTVREQLLYEIHDPRRYITPDAVVDLTTVRLEDDGPDRVKVSGAKGSPAPPTLKAIMGYSNGFMGMGMVGFSWPNALSKAKRAADIVRKQADRMGIQYEEFSADFLGVNALHGPAAPILDEDFINEVFLRVTIRTKDRAEAEKIGRLLPPLVLNGPPGVAMMPFAARPRELIGLWSFLVPRELIESQVRVSVEEVR
ncbi:MAG: acyclic terpene utilization AtuA family protein [Limnochordales bacterium]